MKIQRSSDWIDHVLAIMVILFVWFCVMVVKEAQAHNERLQAPKHEVRSQYREIPQCDKELWLRIKDGCP